MFAELQRQIRSDVIRTFGKAQAQRLGLIAADSVARLDNREVDPNEICCGVGVKPFHASTVRPGC